MIASASRVEQIALALIRDDRQLQMRQQLSEEAVSEYEAHYREGGADAMPPVVGFRDASRLVWLADGFHRVRAARRAGILRLPVEVRSGTKKDAMLYAAGANSQHGVARRTNADKRRAIIAVLEQKEWRTWSDHRIAEACRVSHQLVAQLRLSLYPKEDKAEWVGKDGRTVPRYTKRVRGDVVVGNDEPDRLANCPKFGGRQVCCPRCGKQFNV